MQRFGGREDRLRTVIRIFLDEAKSLMPDLQNAIAAGDAARISFAAHSLKGAVGVFGATAAAEAAFALETLGETGELNGAALAFEHLDDELCRLTSAWRCYFETSTRPDLTMILDGQLEPGASQDEPLTRRAGARSLRKWHVCAVFGFFLLLNCSLFSCSLFSAYWRKNRRLTSVIALPVELKRTVVGERAHQQQTAAADAA